MSRESRGNRESQSNDCKYYCNDVMEIRMSSLGKVAHNYVGKRPHQYLCYPELFYICCGMSNSITDISYNMHVIYIN